MAGMRRKRWLVIAVVVAAGGLLGVAGDVVFQHVRPRLPALAAATPTLDQAIALVITAAGGNAAVAVSGLVPSTSCEHTFLAKGSRYTRTANLYTDPGEESTVIDSIASALPAAEHAVHQGARTLTADLGGGLHLQVLTIGAGWIAATASTDCRTGADTQVPDPAADTAPVTALLNELGTSPAGFHTDAVACPGGAIVTLDAISQPTATDNLLHRLEAHLPAGAREFRSDSNRLAWRDQKVSTIVASSDDGTQITVQRTTAC
jgi:hypothetical protein